MSSDTKLFKTSTQGTYNRPEIGGYCEVGSSGRRGVSTPPGRFSKNQYLLGLNPTELVVLINLTMHWWYPKQRPFPRPTTIAERMGVDVRTVQRSLSRISELGLIRRIKTGSGASTEIDLDGLVERLGNLALTDPAYLHRAAQAQTTEVATLDV